jgi:hypothetical protein
VTKEESKAVAGMQLELPLVKEFDESDGLRSEEMSNTVPFAQPNNPNLLKPNEKEITEFIYIVPHKLIVINKYLDHLWSIFSICC